MQTDSHTTVTEPAQSPWQLQLARVIAVFMAFCHAGGLIGLTAIVVRGEAGSLMPMAMVLLSGASIVLAFATTVTTLIRPRLAWVGFLVLLILYAAMSVQYAFSPSRLPMPMAAMVMIASVVFGLGVFGVPLVLLLWVRRAL